MKKTIFLFIIALTAASCSLNEEIVSSSVAETYYTSVEACRTGLNGCYIPLKSYCGSYLFFEITECQSDLAYCNSVAQPNANLQITSSIPGYGRTMWTEGYNGVMRCNAVLAAIEKSPLKEEDKAPLRAEGVILRAFFYYLLTSTFGDVPFYEEEVTQANNAKITHLPRMSASLIRNTMIDEIEEVLVTKKSLDYVSTYEEGNSHSFRVGAAVGFMLAGKMCLWEGRYSEAVELLGYLEDIYGNGAGNPDGCLARYPVAQNKFGYKFGAESIFEIPYEFSDYGLQIYHSLSAHLLPPRSATFSESDDDYEGEEDEISSDFYNGVGITELGNESYTSSPIRPTKHLYMDLLPYGTADKRTCSMTSSGIVEDGGGTLAWGWVGYAKSDDRSIAGKRFLFFSSVGGQTSRPFLGDKFWCFGMHYTSDANNLKMFRFATAVLALSEAHLYRGDVEKSVAYLNAVRSRAGLLPYNAADYSIEEIMGLIRDECGRELMGEFQRKFDLVRWDIWYDTMLEYAEGSRIRNNLKPCHRYYPIPFEEITYSGGALDNNEYKACGI